MDRSGIVRGLARSAPLVGIPNPSQTEVVAAVWNRLRRFRAGQPEWFGFSQIGDGPPYSLYRLDKGAIVCRAEAVSKPGPIFMALDSPDVAVASPVRGGE